MSNSLEHSHGAAGWFLFDLIDAEIKSQTAFRYASSAENTLTPNFDLVWRPINTMKPPQQLEIAKCTIEFEYTLIDTVVIADHNLTNKTNLIVKVGGKFIHGVPQNYSNDITSHEFKLDEPVAADSIEVSITQSQKKIPEYFHIGKILFGRRWQPKPILGHDNNFSWGMDVAPRSKHSYYGDGPLLFSTSDAARASGSVRYSRLDYDDVEYLMTRVMPRLANTLTYFSPHPQNGGQWQFGRGVYYAQMPPIVRMRGGVTPTEIKLTSPY